MTDLHIRVDATEALGLMGRISDNFLTAQTWALNRTAEDVTAELRREASTRFIFRESRGQRVLSFYAPRTLPNVLRAKDNKPWATAVDPESSGKILRPFETGSPKIGSREKPVTIPTKALRPTPQTVIPRSMFPSALFPQTTRYSIPLKSGKTRRSKSWKAVRPFILDPTTMRGLGPKAWGLYQRTGPKRGDIRMLWAFRLQNKRPDLLDTYATSGRVVKQRWAVNILGAFRAIAHSPRGKASLLDLGV